MTNKSKNLSQEMRKNIILNYGLRGIGILLGLLSTSINLSYLGPNLYGQWATIASIAAWINYGDFGIGNGFRNEFAKAVAQKDSEKQKCLIITTARMLGLLSVVLFLILIVLTEVFFVTGVMHNSLRIPMYITNFFFCIDLFLGIGRSAAHGYQKSWLTSLAQSSTVILRILGVLYLCNFTANLTVFALVNGVAGVIGNAVLLVVLAYQIKLSFEKEVRGYIDNSLRKPILGLGLQFFILQIACLVLYSSDNLIINSLLSSESVTKYDIITKIYNTGESLFSILLISLWSAVTYAFTKNDYSWIKKEINKMIMCWMAFSLGVIIVSILFNPIIKIWLGHNSIEYEWSTIGLFALYTIWGTFGSIFVNISNGLGRLKIQLIASSIEAIINIPLSIFFASTLGMGIFGVKLATLCCCIGANVFVPIDIIRYLKNTKNTNK